MAVNGDFDFDLEVDEQSEATLKIENKGQTNREKVTQHDIGKTSWKSRLHLVQYGTYSGRRAVLVVFKNEFHFIPETIKRITSVSLEFVFEETSGSNLATPVPRIVNNDPQIQLLAPAQVCGTNLKEQLTTTWKLSVPLLFQGAGVQPEVERESASERNHRMWLLGFSQGTDEHDVDNRAKWICKENTVDSTGILQEFTTAVVVTLPVKPERPIKVTALIHPYVAFSVNILRLRKKKDEAIFLDGQTAKGKPIRPDLDFEDPVFPWKEVVNIPEEYQVRLPNSRCERS